MKKAVSFILCFVLGFGFFAFKADALGTSAQAHILMDADSGIILSQNNENTKMKMASTTKIMTTLLALEEAEKKDKVVTFTEDMIAEGSSMYLQVGDKVRLSDLAKGMMMASGNDAANATALTLSKSFEEFAILMNARAERIGMKNTNFVTPSGLDDDNHYSTAFDMALLMAEAIKNEDFCKISASKEEKIEFVYPEGKISTYPNHNRLLSIYKYSTGGKTGYTRAAGRCLVSSAEKDGVTLIAVTLNASDDWNDHKALYEYGFSLYTQIEPENNRIFNIRVSGGEEDFLTASADEDTPFSVPANRINDIEKKIYLPSFVFAPVSESDIVGKITYTLDGKELKTTYIKADSSVAEKPQPNLFIRIFNAIFSRE
ncbi:MAG: D-alanyl-D-alanine carboxypeptidase [Clostridia bacterium]|nr:D-alanyl-D-alanine carboxypeptidase [Clostridia bacterium]